MISSTFGAPLGGTTDGGQYDLESFASSLITPPNFGGSGGSCLPSRVIVALGVPGVPVICWAWAVRVTNESTREIADNRRAIELFTFRFVMCASDYASCCDHGRRECLSPSAVYPR